MSDSATVQPSGEIVARADFQYRWRVYALFILLFGYGLWSLYDGFIAWPQQNVQREQDEARGERVQKPHNEAALLINQGLGILLTGISLPLFGWMMYRSRGRYRLSGDTLHVPGHPPMTLDQIRSLDMTRWDRKGVAVAEYELPGGKAGTLSLRDMIYQREPTDQIVHRIEAHLNPQDAPSAADQQASG